MMGKSIRKTCILKIADVAPSSGLDFSEAIQNAVEIIDKAAQRRLVLDEEPKRYRLLNDFFPPVGSIRSSRGSVFAFTENQCLNGVVLTPNVDSYPITVLSPPSRGKDRTEFIEGLTWFSVFENYIAFFTDRTVFPSALENYFGWLLSEATHRRTGNDANIAVAFRDPPKPNLADYDMTGVSSLLFKESMQSVVEIPSSQNRQRNTSVVRPTGKAYEVLKAFLKKLGAVPPSFSDVQTPDQLKNLRIEVRISCLRPNDGGAAVSALKRTAEHIRDAGVGNVTFKFADGRVLDANDLAITGSMTIPAENGLPDTREAVQKLDRWMMGQIELLTIPQPDGDD